MLTLEELEKGLMLSDEGDPYPTCRYRRGPFVFSVEEAGDLVREAEVQLRTAVLKILEGLTEAEGLRVVNAVLSSHVGSVAKYAIREERHGDLDKPGGLE